MKKTIKRRCLAWVLSGLAMLSVVAAAGAAAYTADLDGDGKITAFDAQILAESNAGIRQPLTEQNLSVRDILSVVFGKADEAPGQQVQIKTVKDLRLMENFPDRDYTLMADIDLQGAAWTPVENFSGTFDGNGYTISNFTIEDSKREELGFFATVTQTARVDNLALRNVTVKATGNNRYVGIIAGISRGQMLDITATGAIYDSREATKGVAIGAFFGGLEEPTGPHTGGTTITVCDDTGLHSVSGLCADVKLYIPENAENHGLCGWYDEFGMVSGLWRDSTNCGENESDILRERQEIAVNYMNAMATVPWTVSEEMVFEHHRQEGVHTVKCQVFQPCVTYYGLPYNYRGGSLERFMYCMDSIDGKNVATTRYGTHCSLTNDDGWQHYMGNDCMFALAWSWMQISPNRVGTYKIVNGQVAEQNSTEFCGGAYVYMVKNMVPSLNTETRTLKNENGESVSAQLTYRQIYGIYPVGDWTVTGLPGYKNCDEVTGTFAYEVTNEVATEEVLQTNGPEVMYEAYAVTRKADGLVLCVSGTGHVRLVTSYPVVIRDAEGAIDPYESFLVCSEQGDGLYDADTNSSWRVNHKWSFYNLLGYQDPNLPADYKYDQGVYIPVTIRALRADYVKSAYLTEGVKVTAPDTGWVYSNWRILSSTLTVQDAAGKELYTNMVYAGLDSDRVADDGVTQSYDYCKGDGEIVSLGYAHAPAFREFAEANLEKGQTYYFRFQVELSNGQILTLGTDTHKGQEFEAFIYN